MKRPDSDTPQDEDQDEVETQEGEQQEEVKTSQEAENEYRVFLSPLMSYHSIS